MEINHPWTGVPHMISPHTLRLMITVRETIAVTQKELQDNLKVAGTTIIQRTALQSPFLHPTQNLFY